jgi:hypothetical protein
MSVLNYLLEQPAVYRLWQAPFASAKLEPSAFFVAKASALAIYDFVDRLKHKLELIIPAAGLTVTFGSAGSTPLQPTTDELPQYPSPELRQSCSVARDGR